MSMADLLVQIGPAWAWVIAGLVLGAGELVAPGVFLIWLGLAAIATGLLMLGVVPSWPLQLLVFAILAVVAVFIGRRVTRNPPSNLNRRGHDLVGRTMVLDQPITDGVGRLRQGDTSWRITGPDLPVGAAVTVLAMEGTTLVVGASQQG